MGIGPRGNNGGTNGSWKWTDIPGAIIVLIFYWPYTMAKKYVYHDFDGRAAQVIGVAIGFYFGAMKVGNLVGWQWNLPWYCWLPAAALGWWYVYSTIWPIVFKIFIFPLWWLCEAIFKRVNRFAQKHWETVAREIVVKITPLSMWDKLLAGKKNGWFADVLGFITYGSLIAGSVYLAWTVYGSISTLVPPLVPWFGLGSAVGIVAAAAAGFVVLVMVGGLGFQYLRYGKVPGIALVSGAVAAGAVVWYRDALPPMSEYLLAGASLFAFWAIVEIFPAVVLMFSNGFWERLWEKVLEPLGEQAYWRDYEKDKDYIRFFHHVSDLGIAALIGWGAFYLCAALPLSMPVVVGIVAAATWCGYALGLKAIDWEGGNFLLGGGSSAYIAFEAGRLYANADWYGSVYGGIVIAVATLLVCAMIVWPVLYWMLRSVVKTLHATVLGNVLAAVYKPTDKAIEAMQKSIKALCKTAYDKDDSKPHVNFLHLLNLGVALTIAWLLVQYGVVLTVAPWLALAALFVLPLLSYLLLGRLMLKTGYGVAFVSAVSGGILAMIVGLHIYALGENVLAVQIAACASALFTWLAYGFILFPLIFDLLRPSLGRLPGLGALGSLYNFVWKLFEGFFNGIWSAFKAIAAPLTMFVVGMLTKIKQAYDRLIAVIGGRR